MQLQHPFASTIEHEQSRLFVWLDRGNYKPRFATGDSRQSWMGRCTLRDPGYRGCSLDANGSELWIYKSKAMDIVDVYHWYILDARRRRIVAKGTQPQLEYAAEEIYRAYFRIVTDEAFADAIIPKEGKDVGIYGNWIPQAEATRLGLQVFATDTRDDLVFALGYPKMQKDRIISTIQSVSKNSHRGTDQSNFTLLLKSGCTVEGLDWHLISPEQYVPGNAVLQCRQCLNITPKAFDVRWVRGFGPVCGMSRDHYMDQGLIHESDWDNPNNLYLDQD